MSEIKKDAKNFLGAGLNLGKSLIKEGQKLFDENVKPAVDDVANKVKQEQVKHKLKTEKADVTAKQNKSKRKYHRGG